MLRLSGSAAMCTCLTDTALAMDHGIARISTYRLSKSRVIYLSLEFEKKKYQKSVSCMRNPGAGRAQRKWPPPSQVRRSDGRPFCAHTIELEYEGYPYPDVEPWLNLDRKRRVEAGDARRRRRGPPGPTTVVVLASRRFARHRAAARAHHLGNDEPLLSRTQPGAQLSRLR